MEDSLVGTTYIGEISENGRIKERMMKNVESKEIKEVWEAAHHTPALNVTQEIRKTLWPDDQKDLKIWSAH